MIDPRVTAESVAEARGLSPTSSQWRHSLEDLLAQCDEYAPRPTIIDAWMGMPAVGAEEDL